MNNNKSSGIWDSKECALILIDFQPGVMSYIRSSDPKLVELNGRYLAKAALAFDIPIILSTVGVKSAGNQPTIESLRNEIPDIPEIDRSSMDSWGDKGFVDAVKKTGRKRLVMCGILTEVCLAYPVVNALKDDYEVCFIADASGGASKEAHDMAVLRMIQAGAVPNTTSAMIAEWFRDWSGPLAPAAREVVVPFVRETAMVQDIYSRIEASQAADTRAAEAWAAKKQSAVI
ncbi:MAG TPA: isochorismatase family protein [Pedobacter sp.]|uniref:isochorismatase family protein n=1 Tax=Pedobacter sp. TaxID=1411316 RepID=UPI002CC6515C|nr:isochorismatase family protein [Pedobacter sp.]HMI05232.1 isochorismatase family protein [Pedobacter sp.]